jgi:hypothetical protein
MEDIGVWNGAFRQFEGEESLSCELGMVLRIVIGGGYMTAKL